MGKILGITAALVTFFAFHFVWWMSAGIGVFLWIWMMPKAGSTKLIQVVDLEKGRITTQPLDRAAEKYLSTRND